MRHVAAFDFDGTLTKHDTLVPYLRMSLGTFTVAKAALLTSPRLIAAGLDDRRRDAGKAEFLRRLLRGEPERRLRELGERFADDVLADGTRPEMIERLRTHQRDGHEVVIVSASPSLYLDAIGTRLAVDAVLATQLEVGSDGRLTGELVGRNVRREEKVRRLDVWLGGPAEVWAYGNSTGDTELLARADHAERV